MGGTCNCVGENMIGWKGLRENYIFVQIMTIALIKLVTNMYKNITSTIN